MATSQHNNQGGDDKCVTSNISPNEQNVRQTHHCFLPDSPCWLCATRPNGVSLKVNRASQTKITIVFLCCWPNKVWQMKDGTNRELFLTCNLAVSWCPGDNTTTTTFQRKTFTAAKVHDQEIEHVMMHFACWLSLVWVLDTNSNFSCFDNDEVLFCWQLLKLSSRKKCARPSRDTAVQNPALFEGRESLIFCLCQKASSTEKRQHEESAMRKNWVTSQFEFICRCKCVPVTFLNFVLCKNSTCKTETLHASTSCFKLFGVKSQRQLSNCKFANKIDTMIGLLSNNHSCIISDCPQLKQVSLTQNEQPTQAIVRLCMQGMKHFFQLLSLTFKKGQCWIKTTHWNQNWQEKASFWGHKTVSQESSREMWRTCEFDKKWKLRLGLPTSCTTLPFHSGFWTEMTSLWRIWHRHMFHCELSSVCIKATFKHSWCDEFDWNTDCRCELRRTLLGLCQLWATTMTFVATARFAIALAQKTFG